jgi:ABC-type amino acid transport substrate-binding protein
MWRRYLVLACLLPLPVLAGSIKVCAEAWPPMLYRDGDGKVAGMAADWLAEAADTQGLRLQYQFLSLQTCRNLAASGAVDVLAFTPNTAKLEDWVFTQEPFVYWVLNAFVPYRSSHTRFHKLSQFAGQRVGWGQYYRYPDRLALQQGWQRVMAFDADAVFALLVRGKVDVAFDDERFVASTLSLESRQQLRVLYPAAASMAQPVAVRPGLAGFAAALDKRAVAWRRLGLLDRFYREQYHSSLDDIIAIAR